MRCNTQPRSAVGSCIAVDHDGHELSYLGEEFVLIVLRSLSGADRRYATTPWCSKLNSHYLLKLLYTMYTIELNIKKIDVDASKCLLADAYLTLDASYYQSRTVDRRMNNVYTSVPILEQHSSDSRAAGIDYV